MYVYVRRRAVKVKVKLSLDLIKNHHAMKTFGEIQVLLQHF
jgi:hypothetical protein